MQARSNLSRFGRFLLSSEGKAESKLPTLILITILGVGGYVGWNFFVPYWNNRALTDFIKDSAVFDPFEKKKPTEESVRGGVMNKMRELGIRFEENKDGQKLEVIQKTDLAFEVNLTYKQTIRIYGRKPETRTYEIRFDGTETAKAIIKEKPIQ